jgi:cell division protein FtsL
MKPLQTLLIVLGVLFVTLLLLMPKIYLQNNIYYVSKDINRLHTQYVSLKEENKALKQQHEDALFQNQIMDSLILENFYNSESE